LPAGADDETVSAINALDLDEVLLFDGGIESLRAIRGIDNTPTSFDVQIQGPDGLATGADPGFGLRLSTRKGRLLARNRRPVRGGQRRDDRQLRRALRTAQRFRHAAHRRPAAGRRRLARRREHAPPPHRPLTGQAGDLDQPLLSPLFYIQRALQPFADLVEGQSGDLSVDIPALIEQGPAMIVMADIGVLPDAASTS
jgi:hypothetical protein